MVSKTMPAPSEEDPNLQIVTRLGSLPIVVSTMEQLGVLYNHTKQSSNVVKIGLTAAETGLLLAGAIATPVIAKFEAPVKSLDQLAVSKLDQLEEKLPMLRKPVPQVLQEATSLYNNTLRPKVDRIAMATQAGFNTYTNVKDYGVQKASELKTYSAETVSSVVGHGRSTVGHMFENNMKKVQAVKDYTMSTKKCLTDGLSHSMEDVINSRASGVTLAAEHYIDAYAPNFLGPKEERPKEPVRLVKHASKQTHMRCMAKLEHVALRSAEVVSKLNYTIDLMDYAKSHLDSSKAALANGLVRSRDKMWSVWEQVQQSEEEALADDTPSKGLQRRLIRTARHLTANLRTILDRAPAGTGYLPTALFTAAATTTSLATSLYTSLDSVKSLDDVEASLITLARALVQQAQTHSTSLLNYVRAPFKMDAVPQPAAEEEEIPLVPDDDDKAVTKHDLDEKESEGEAEF